MIKMYYIKIYLDQDIDLMALNEPLDRLGYIHPEESVLYSDVSRSDCIILLL